jgi:phosphopantothenoylcysteine synthetase/decarboxylase
MTEKRYAEQCDVILKVKGLSHNEKIILGISSSIAAYKACDLTASLSRADIPCMW